MSVPSIHHPKIIGRKGLVIQRIRTEHQVNIQFPPVNAPEGENDMITITGYESNCEAAKKDIQQIVDDLVSLLGKCSSMRSCTIEDKETCLITKYTYAIPLVWYIRACYKPWHEKNDNNQVIDLLSNPR